MPDPATDLASTCALSNSGEYLFNLAEIRGLHQMMIEAGFLRTLFIRILAIAGHRDENNIAELKLLANSSWQPQSRPSPATQYPTRSNWVDTCGPLPRQSGHREPLEPGDRSLSITWPKSEPHRHCHPQPAPATADLLSRPVSGVSDGRLERWSRDQWQSHDELATLTERAMRLNSAIVHHDQSLDQSQSDA